MDNQFDVEELIERLKDSESKYNRVKEDYYDQISDIIKEEAKLVRSFSQKLMDFSDTRHVHGQKAVVLYIFQVNNKQLISEKVYIREDGNIIYEVYDEKEYRKYRPNAVIEEGFNIIKLDEFLMHVPFYKILDYFENRVEIKDEDADEFLRDKNYRKLFNEELSNLL